jgi:hypothetical protein
MKIIIYLSVLVLFVTACKKEMNGCKDYKEAAAKERLIEPAAVDFQAFKDTLNKYANFLKPSEYQVFPYGRHLKCYAYYQGLLVFSEFYYLSTYNAMDSIGAQGVALSRLRGISIAPGVSYTEAIKKARYEADFDHTCISYRLGVFNKNMFNGSAPDYRLAWMITGGDNAYPTVIMDAQTNEVLQGRNGRYWVY